MSFLTVEIELNHGHVLPKGLESLPEKASGLLTILPPAPLTQLRPIGLALGQFTVPEDFNAPLPEEVLQAFEGQRKSCWIPANSSGLCPAMPNRDAGDGLLNPKTVAGEGR